ncbi:Fe-S cluster assembly protein IscX [Longispora sp. K20-0274]|uniref:Fe-S cluster assembly protein IscX n=1 Tax=Longispora sp. K20-0274 TaxID=3088255 RepID=UPI0039998B90
MAPEWIDAHEIGLNLAAAHPGVDPSSVPSPQVREWVTGLELFFDPDPGGGDEEQLRAIVEEWAAAARAAQVDVSEDAGGGVMRQTPPANRPDRSRPPRPPQSRTGLYGPPSKILPE